MGIYSYSSRPTRGAARDRHERGAGCGGRGSVRPERRLQGASPEQGCFPHWGAFELRTLRERAEVRLTTTLRVAAGVEIRLTVTPLRGGPSRVVLAEIRPALFARQPARKKYRGDDGVRLRPLPGRARSKSKNHRVRNAGCVRCFRG